MSCYHPIRRWEFDGKVRFSPSDRKDYYGHSADKYSMLIPCGQCIGCRLDYSRQWANRIMLEAKQWPDNWFVTLTYDPEHLPTHVKLEPYTGELLEVGTLVPKDLQDFLKRLRRYYEYHYDHKPIRFFACGEYGDDRGRPHYHPIIFNLPLYDLVQVDVTDNGDVLYESAALTNLWGKGLVRIGAVTWQSAAYVARYVTKKIKGKQAAEYYDANGIVPEFVRMSTRPGIGKAYFDANSERIYANDEIILPTSKGAQAVKPPTYYDRLLHRIDPDKLEQVKARRVDLQRWSTANKMANTSLSEQAQREVDEAYKLDQLRQLRRDKI